MPTSLIINIAIVFGLLFLTIFKKNLFIYLAAAIASLGIVFYTGTINDWIQWSAGVIFAYCCVGMYATATE